MSNLLIGIWLSFFAFAETDCHFQVGGSNSLAMKAGQSSKWTFHFMNKETGAPAHLMEMHEKLVHLIVISEDLNDFAHVHPTGSHHGGMFEINVNSPQTDPDNFDLPKVVPRGGNYFVLPEVMPMDDGMVTFPFVLNSNGPKSFIPVVEDKMLFPGVIQKYFNEMGEISNQGGLFRVTLNLEYLEEHQINNVKFRLKVESNNGGNYEPVANINRWLGSYAHGFLISAGSFPIAEKKFLHIHSVFPMPEDPNPDGLINLVAHSHGKLPNGLYKIWFQFKLGEKVMTIPFAMKLIFNTEE